MEIVKAFSEKYIISAMDKIKEIDFLEKSVKYKCIYTKGVFDILHFGHMALFSFLNELKIKHSLAVVVGITSDKIVKEKKGISRPINSEILRIKQVALLPQIDYVHIHNDSNYKNVISSIKPVIYIKGMDTVIDETDIQKYNPEITHLEWDSSFVIFVDNNEISTSTIIEKIRHS